jgi:hypothetical protein
LTGARAPFSALRAAVKIVAPVVLACLAAGCSNNKSYYGTPVVTLTSSYAGFASYRIFIDSVVLTRSDGFIASLLSSPEQVDLVSLYNHTELLGAPAVPSGTYVSATITFDFGTAFSPDINVNNDALVTPVAYLGSSTNTSQPYLQNLDNAAIGGSGVQVTVTFDPKNLLVINSNQSTRLAFDVDLEASNIINLSYYLAATNPDSSPTVYANPMVTPTPTPVDDRPVRARGVMVQVQPDQSTFVMNMHPLNEQAYTLGAMTVKTNAQTYFNLNGVTSVGPQGLAALEALNAAAPNTIVAAWGSVGNLNPGGVNVGITPTFNATTVIGGSGLESTLQSHLIGTVAGIVPSSTQNGVTSSAQVVLRGATLIPPDEVIYYYGSTYPGTVPYVSENSTVLVDPATTIVSQDGVASPVPTAQTISIGDFIDASGQSSVDPTNGYLTLDASLAGWTTVFPTAPLTLTGQVRILPTQLWGTLNTATQGSATLNLLQLGIYQTPAFTFNGTGSTATSYITATGSTNLSAVPAGSLLYMNGSPSPWGSAPPDFSASAVTLPAEQQSELILEWWNDQKSGTASPFSNMTPTTLTINATEPHLSRHVLKTGPVSQDLGDVSIFTQGYPVIALATPVNPPMDSPRLTLGGPLFSITPSNLANFPSGQFVNELVFSNMTDFQNEMGTITGTTYNGTFNKLVAVGKYDSASNTFTATRITMSAKK